MRAARFVAIGLVSVLAAGCGSDSGGSDNGDGGSASGDSDNGGDVVVPGAPEAEAGQAAGIVQLPEGYAGSELLTVTTGGGSGEVVGGGWVADLPEGDTALAIVTDDVGNVVLTGFVEPGRSNMVNSRSSAVVAAFFAAHLFELPGEARGQAIEDLRAHAAMDALGATFAEALARDSAVLMTEDAGLLEAVGNALHVLAGSTGADSGLIRRGGALNVGNANVIVDPLTEQSGVLVGPNLTGTGMQIHNASRRLGWYYVYETGFRGVSGDDVATDPPVLLSEGFVASAAGISSAGGTIGVVTGALSNSLDFSPTELAQPIGLTVGQDQQRLFVEVIVAGAYLPGAGSVASWLDDSDPRHAEWLSRARLMTTASFVRDVLIPAIFTVALPVKGGAEGLLDLPTLESIGVSLVAAAPALADQIDGGEWGAALKTTMITLAGNSNLRTAIALELSEVVRAFASDQAQNSMNLMMKANFYTAVVDLGLAGLDIAMVVDEVAEGGAVERWDVTAIKAKVLVRAHRTTLDPARPDTRLTATVPEAAPDEYHCFVWTVSEGPGAIAGLLEGPDTGSERIAVSDDGEALYDVSPSDIESDGPLAVITVEAYLRSSDEACAYPPAGELIGEGKVGLLGTTEPYEDPCTDGSQTFDFGYWNHDQTTPSYSISGQIGGTVTVNVTVPPVDLDDEGDYRDVDIVIPRPASLDREDIRVSGANVRSWNIYDAGGWIYQVRRDDDDSAPVKWVQMGDDDARFELSAHGDVSVSIPTEAFPQGCIAWGECCPYVGSGGGRSALMGPFVFIRLRAKLGEGIFHSTVVDRVEVGDL